MPDENPFSQVASGFSAGVNAGSQQAQTAASWAHTMSQIDIARQQKQIQLDQLQEMKREHDINAGKEITAQLDKIFTEGDPTVRNKRIQGFQSWAETAGYKVDPFFVEGLKSDQTRATFYSGIQKIMDPGVPPEVKSTLLSGVGQWIGSDKAVKLLEQAQNVATRVKTAEITAKGREAFVDPKLQGLSAQVSDKITSNPLVKLTDQQGAKLNDFDEIARAIGRGEKTFDKVTYAEMTTALAGIAVQSNLVGLGAQERNEWNPVITQVKHAVAKLGDFDVNENSQTQLNKLMATRDAVAQAIDDTRKNKAAQIAKANLATVGKNPYMKDAITNAVGTFGLTFDDVVKYQPKQIQKMQGKINLSNPTGPDSEAPAAPAQKVDYSQLTPTQRVQTVSQKYGAKMSQSLLKLQANKQTRADIKAKLGGQIPDDAFDIMGMQ